MHYVISEKNINLQQRRHQRRHSLLLMLSCAVCVQLPLDFRVAAAADAAARERVNPVGDDQSSASAPANDDKFAVSCTAAAAAAASML